LVPKKEKDDTIRRSSKGEGGRKRERSNMCKGEWVRSRAVPKRPTQKVQTSRKERPGRANCLVLKTDRGGNGEEPFEDVAIREERHAQPSWKKKNKGTIQEGLRSEMRKRRRGGNQSLLSVSGTERSPSSLARPGRRIELREPWSM